MHGLILAAVLAAPAAAADAPAALTGSWTAVEAQRDGAEAPELIGHRLVLEAQAFRILAADGKPLYAGRYAVDAAARPARIDFVQEAGEAKGQTWEGIWRIDGERLTIVDDAPDPAKARPTDFGTEKGSGYVMVVFRR